MPEYREKKGDEKMEAFNDRTKRVDFPYVLEYDEESEIYRKMLRNADVPDMHIEPHALEMAGLFGVLTRLAEPDTNASLVQKAKAYNGELDDGDDVDVRKLRENAEESTDIGEGMDGVSARFIGDEIAEAIMDATHRDRTYLSPLSVFSHFETNLENHGSIPEENLDQYHRYLEMVREEYRERAIEDVRHALAYDLDEIQRQGEKYMDHVMAYIDDATVEDALTGREQDPDETFLRSVEKNLTFLRIEKMISDRRSQTGFHVVLVKGHRLTRMIMTAFAVHLSANSGRTKSTISISQRLLAQTNLMMMSEMHGLRHLLIADIHKQAHRKS
jgi:Putative Ser protein kinase